MRRDLTTSSTERQAAAAHSASAAPPARRSRRLGDLSLISIAQLIGVLVIALLLLTLLYQIPATHNVDIGGYDAAYVQGFYDAERADSPDLAGSDGSARWSRAVSYLLFPQVGLPAQVTLRLRGPASDPPHELVVLLNGVRELGRIQPGADWEEHSFTIDGGLLKPNDVVIELRSTVALLRADDSRLVGVLLDRASYRTSGWPITPYPTQLAYGALAAGMLYALFQNKEQRTENKGAQEPRTKNREPQNRVPSERTAEPTQNKEQRTENKGAGTARPSKSAPIYLVILSSCHLVIIPALLALGLAFLFLYRLQPVYPYPLLRLLPAIDLALAALLALRHGPALARRAPLLLDGLALGAIGAWTVALLLSARDHLTLSIPGVENDFGVFARRSTQLAGIFQPSGIYGNTVDGVFRADGFYNLGYPLLLWLLRPLTQSNPFLAAQLISALSGALLLGAAWWLARRLLGRAPALLTLLILALSPLVVEYGLYIGTDMLFAALCTLALALLTTERRQQTGDSRQERPGLMSPVSVLVSPVSVLVSPVSVLGVILAGLAAGAAFLVRHPGLLLLPIGWLVLWLTHRPPTTEADDSTQDASRLLSLVSRLSSHILFTLAFLLAIAPQLFVNIRDTGQPLYSQQAKNIWLCVYGSCDWGRWDEAPNSVTLSEVVLRDPGRFLANWWANLRGFFGSGAEDTSEFGHAVQLRLLGFPANWLALGGLLAWLVTLFRRSADVSSPAHPLTRSSAHLLLWLALYIPTVSVGLMLPRFFLPLAPIYAIAAAWLIAQVDTRHETRDTRHETRDTRSAVSHLLSLVARLWSVVRGPSSVVVSILLLLVLWGGFATGRDYVLRNQPPDEVAALRLAQATLGPGEQLAMRVPPRLTIGQYSAIAHLVVPDGGKYLLALGGDAPTGSTVVGTAGQFTLYRLAP